MKGLAGVYAVLVGMGFYLGLHRLRKGFGVLGLTNSRVVEGFGLAILGFRSVRD